MTGLKKKSLLATFKSSNMNYNHRSVYYIPMSYLLYNWKFVAFGLLHTFQPLPLAAISFFSVSVTSVPSFCFWFFFPESTYKWGHTVRVYVFLCLTSLSIMPSSIHVVTNGRISFFYYWIIFNCIHATFKKKSLDDLLFPCLGNCKKCCIEHWSVDIFQNSDFGSFG